MLVVFLATHAMRPPALLLLLLLLQAGCWC
jgi:hypothetical protein